MMTDFRCRVEPSHVELSAIEVEWPVIAAELAVVDAQCRLVAFPSVLTVRALRRAERRLLVVVRSAANQGRSTDLSVAAAA